jgi:WD40 repeat protein
MSPAWTSGFDTLAARDKKLVNEACRRFERSLRDDPATRLEPHLTGVPDELRPVLLAELLFLECEARSRRGMPADPEELARRFPGRESTIAEVLAHVTPHADRSPTLGDGTTPGPTAVGRDLVPAALGRFRPKAVLGRGGFGIVYLAHDPREGGDVALKVPHLETLLAPELRGRFLREAEVARSLDHPNLVRVLDVGEVGLLCYIATAYVPGTTLSGWMADRRRRGEPVPAAVAARLIVTLAEAVHHAHERGILHCDIKPANILLPDGPEPAPLLADFGLARLVGDPSELSGGSQVLGTPAYMAPEQAAGRRREVTSRTDVYALGAVLYELLAGRHPFAAPSSVETLHRVLSDEPEPPRWHRRHDAPADLEAVCMKCLDKHPDRRYPSAAALAADLRRFLQGAATEARPPGIARQVLSWGRRRPAAAVLALAVTFGLLSATAASVYHSTRLGASNRDLTAALDERDAVNSQLTVEKERLTARERALRQRGYPGEMRQALALLDRNERGELERLLREWEPAAGEEDLRGFEWYYLSRQVGLHEVACLTPSQGVCYSLCYSPDGRTLAVGGADGCVRLLDPETGRELLPPLHHPDEINQVVYSPDGRHLATACDDGKARLWSAGGELVRTWAGHDKKVHEVAFHPDGRSLASVSEDGTCRLWEVGDGGTGGRLLLTRRAPLQSVSFNPEGTLLLVGGQDRTIAVCDLKSGLLCGTLEGHAGGVNVIQFGEHGETFTCGDRGGGLTEWEAAPGAGGTATWRVRSRAACRFEGVSGMALSPDERFVALATNQAVEVWSRGPLRLRWSFHGHEGKVWGVCFSPDGRRLATAGADRTVRVWDFAAATASQEAPAVVQPVRRLFPSDDGTRLAVATTERIEEWRKGHNSYFVRVGHSCGTFSVDAMLPVEGGPLRSLDGMGRVWDWVPSKGGARGLAGSPAGESELVHEPVLSEGSDPADRRPRTLREYHLAAFDPTGHRLAGVDAREVQVWDLTSGRIARSFPPIPTPPSAIAFGPAGQVAVGTTSSEVYLWDVGSGVRRHTLKANGGSVRLLAFSPGGGLLAGASGDGMVTVWDARDWKELVRLSGHRGPVRSAAFSPDGRTLVTGGADGTVRLWQLATGLEAMTFADEDGPVTCIAFSRNGRFLATAAQNGADPGQGVVRVRDCGHSLTPRQR